MFESVEAFYRPATVREALLLLHRGKGSARIVAGGTDVVAGPPESARPVRFLIDITRAGLSYIRPPKGPRGAWALGATTTMAEIEASAGLREVAGGLLAKAAATCGSLEIRNTATVGGNMANGSPAADLATPLLALDATVTIANARGRRKMPLAKYLGCVHHGWVKGTLLVDVSFPAPPRGPRCGWSFQKFGRTALDISVVNVAAALQLDADGRVEWARIALGSVAPTPVRMAQAEALMAGRTFDRALAAEAAVLVERAVQPIGDVRASAEYRRELSRVLSRRALEECARGAGCSL